MRLPFLQVEDDAFRRARVLARLLKCDRHRAISLMLDLWTWALDSNGDDRPSGIVDNPEAAAQVAGAVEWDNDPAQLVAALVSSKLLEEIPEGLRIRGMDRYHAAWDRQEADRQRKAEARAKLAEKRTSTGSPQDVRRTSAGHATEVQRNPTEVRSIDVDVDVDVKNNLTTPPKAKATENGSELRSRLSSVFEQVRGTPYVFTSEEEMTTGRRLLQLAQGERQQKDDEIVRRWRNALTRTRFPTADSLKDLVKHWNAYATEQPAAPAPQYGKPTAHQRPGGIDGLTKAPESSTPCEWAELTNCNGIGIGDSGGKWLCASCLKTSNDYFAGLNKH